MAKKSRNTEAIADHGRNPANYCLLQDPEILATKPASDFETIQNNDHTTMSNPVLINNNISTIGDPLPTNNNTTTIGDVVPTSDNHITIGSPAPTDIYATLAQSNNSPLGELQTV